MDARAKKPQARMKKPFSRIALIGKVEDARVAETLVAVAQQLRGRGLAVVVGREAELSGLPEGVERQPAAELGSHADLIVAIGGDGTMLFAAQLAVGRGIPVLGINRGRLGFLTDVSPEDIVATFDAVLDGRFETDVRDLLRATLSRGGAPAVSYLALNDVVVQRHESGRMVELETWIDGRFVNTHGGDGIVIASSTGSTAYALSCGGPIIHPALGAVVIAPISPHTLSDRPIVISRDSHIEVRLVARSATRAQVTCDGTLLGDLDVDSTLAIEPAAERITFLHPPGHDYFRLLRSKLHWGRSGRTGAADV
jgi:NAD+ kinase